MKSVERGNDQQESLEYDWIRDTHSLEELRQALEDYGTISGSDGIVYTAQELLTIMDDIQAGRSSIDRLTRTGGLRPKFEELSGIKESSHHQSAEQRESESGNDEKYRGLKVGDMVKHPLRDMMTPVEYRGTEVYKFIPPAYVNKRTGEWESRYVTEAIEGSKQYQWLVRHGFLKQHARSEPSIEVDLSQSDASRSIVVPVDKLQLPGRFAKLFRRNKKEG